MAAKSKGKNGPVSTGRTPAKKVGLAKKTPKKPEPKRAYMSQADVPSYSLAQALRIPRAIAEHYGFKPATPLNVAAALDMQPTSSTFRQICGASIAYGLTKGGYNAAEISIEPLGMRIVRPTIEGDDLIAKREALVKPRVVGEFLRRYDNAPLPRDDIGKNVLCDMGVPTDRSAQVLEMIVEGAETVALLRTIKDKRYVDLSGVPMAEADQRNADQSEAGGVPTQSFGDEILAPDSESSQQAYKPSDGSSRRVFITHGKNRAFIDPIKKLLGFGEMEPVVSVDKTSVSQPVPDKVMSEMRSCGSAIIHVDFEQKLIDQDAKEQTILNPNVLIEIGAAMALYGRRFILLVRDGVKLPSNLQGLFEVRYSGEALDGDATIKLLEAINDIKNHPMPDRYSVGE
ncbi:nucleotide-binding protein [Luteimonas sp. Y-2-2-4F]|nr:TIR domain-containing protein [Luteimonas sp. Y-2-2-4F]MCD9031977.1 nucleotide-binding protein [Luteimonas sp. Y-2-2-4F]